MKIHSEQEMLNIAHEFAKKITSTGDAAGGTPTASPRAVGETAAAGPVEANATIIELVGDVGAGKTTFVRGLAEGLGIKEPVTSPSFTISKSYALSDNKRLIHYDFYRLQDPGLMSDDLEENLNNPKNIVVIEWGESIANLLPENRYKITINYTKDGREIIL